MRGWLATLLLATAACTSPGPRALEEREMRAELGEQLLLTLDAQEHYFPGVTDRDDFAERLRAIAARTSDASSYYRSVARALADLDEGHTGLVASPEVPFSETIPPVALLEIDDQVVVAGVAPGVEGGGLRTGDAILLVDGEPAVNVLALRFAETSGSTPHGRRARAVANLLAGPTRTPARVRVRGFDGRERDCYPLRFLLDDEGENRFRFGFAAGTVAGRRIAPDAAYVFLPDFHPDRRRELEEMLRSFHGLPTLVLDLRGNPGGRIQTLQRIAGCFFEEPVDLLTLADRGETRPLRSIPGSVYFRGILRILIDSRTGSAAELLAAALQDLGRARVIGARSAGSSRSRRSAILPGGVVFHYAGTAEFRRRNGEPVEGVGVTPDIAASPTRAALAGGAYGDPARDPAVLLALQRN